MKKRYLIVLAIPVLVFLLFVSYVYLTASMTCNGGELYWDLSCDADGYTNGFVLEKIYEMLSSKDDFDDVPELELFLEKYPESEVLIDFIGYGSHHKRYVYENNDAGGSVYLILTKNVITGNANVVLTCPPNDYNSVGYPVWHEGVKHYLQNHDCFSVVPEKYPSQRFQMMP
ncbi:hypothetical protein K0U27_06470 [archaeon]|nr:hypothetical protein [archaeon]